GDQHFVDFGRVGLAFRGLHDLADEKTDDLGLAVAVLLHLIRVVGNGLIDPGLDGAAVGYLAQAAGVDNGVGRLALAGPQGVEHALGDLAGYGSVDHAPDQAGQLCCAHARPRDVDAVAIKRPGKRAGDP